MAARSTHVTLENRAGSFNLRRTSQGLDHGEWTTKPPLLIGDRGEWESESNGFATGTEGSVTYQLEDVDGVRMGEVSLHWDNPFIGSNSYGESVTPAAADPAGQGFSIVHVGGKGNNSHVTFQLLNGFCEADSDSGEVTCAQGSQLTTDSQRFAALWEQADTGVSWFAVHGQTASEYQETFDRLVGQGYRPVDVSGYSDGGEVFFAAVFEQRDGVPFEARHGLTADQYQETFNELVGRGFRPVDVSGYATSGGPRFAAVFEESGGPPFEARHGLTADQYQQTFNELVGQGFRPVDVSGYSDGGEVFFAAVFEQRDGVPFEARHGLTADQYQETFNELVGRGFRPVDVSGYATSGGPRFAAVFEKSGGPPLEARHGLTAGQYQQTFNELMHRGFRLVKVSGYSVG
ncbi:hypothetical protein ITI46_02720 [Streptomyces oryzae]|uniref:Uncharacterized protein n=1 Tax=Streptomyces oryzae TaxID=1434886 RepID=A0ABS3X5G7_9ACTN|nr:hypothetical protein [Streptomyces oryzae]MBO8190622.1 hypothetical protein [Streptomyces oryzae]